MKSRHLLSLSLTLLPAAFAEPSAHTPSEHAVAATPQAAPEPAPTSALPAVEESSEAPAGASKVTSTAAIATVAPAAPPAATPVPGAEERASLLRIGDAKLAAGDAESALIAYRQVAVVSKIPDELARALLGMARSHRLAGDGVKASATYEHLVRAFPNYAEIPSALLELGRTLRDLGSPKLAINRFYSVIHSTLKLPEAESDRYRRIVRTAQFEIAETHLATGNYPEAVRFFKRLDLLDLAPADRSRARFKAALATVRTGDTNASVAALYSFITSEPNDANSPEARFLLAGLYNQLGRKEESLRVTLDLLHHEQARKDSADTWRQWQRRTGNLLANQLYQQGEFTTALIIYRALATLEDTPAWRIPVLYQVGLCQEKLEQPDAAIATYAELRKLAGDTPAPEFADLAGMADWRSRQLAWTTTTRTEIRALRPEPSTAPVGAEAAL